MENGLDKQPNSLKFFNTSFIIFWLMIACFPLFVGLILVQACTNPSETDYSSNQNHSAMPKEFGDRFSIEKIKQERETYFAKKRLELKRMEPATEASRAIKSNDAYFMVVSAGRGSGQSIPGLVEPQLQIHNCRTVAAEGMGDVLYGANHMSYRQELLTYMRQFNAIIAPYCQ